MRLFAWSEFNRLIQDQDFYAYRIYDVRKLKGIG